MLRNKKNISSGFTLVELSISLVVIGLIVGGILGAQDLLRQAAVRSVISDLNSFRTAINAFQLKYGALPGDLRTASSYWPTCDGTPANCNGDGDNLIDQGTASSSEWYRAWQHLTLSDILPGGYTGTHTAHEAVIGTNVPAAPIDGGGYSFMGFTSTQQSVIRFGAHLANWSASESIITAGEAQTIDDKMDDGLPTEGVILGFGGWNGSQQNPDCRNGAAYDLSKTTVACTIDFYFQR